MEPIKIGWLGSALDGPRWELRPDPSPRVRRGDRGGRDRPRARAAAPVGKERDRRLQAARRRWLHRGLRHRVHVVFLGLRQVRGLGRHRPVVPRQPAELAVARALRRALRRGPAEMWPNAIPVLACDTARVLTEGLHRAPVLTGWGSRPGSSRSGSCRARPVVRRPTSPPARETTRCSAATGCTTAGWETARWCSRAGSHPGSEASPRRTVR